MEIAFNCDYGKDLGVLYKQGEVDQDGKIFSTNIDLANIERVEVVFQIKDNTIKSLAYLIDDRKLSIIFDANTIVTGEHSLQLVAYSKHNEVLESQICNYIIEASLGDV